MEIYFIIYLLSIFDNRTRHLNNNRQNSNFNNRNTAISTSMNGISQNNYLFHESIFN
jgi:hypothetical protein